MTKKTFYFITLLICFLGYSSLFVLPFVMETRPHLDLTVCIFKRVTAIPCLTCGTTRSVHQFFKGEMLNALFLNPLGILVAVFISVEPLWIVYDYLVKKQSFYHSFEKVMIAFKNKKILIALSIVLILNWLWNINKMV